MRCSFAYTTDIWPALITFASATYLGIYGWRRRDIPAARAFAIACLLAGFWILGVILELSAVDFATKVFWVKFQGVWQLPVAATIACFVLQYAGLGQWLNRRTYALLFAVPALSVLFMATNDWHSLIWAGFRMSHYVVVSPGSLFWIFKSYIYLVGLLNLAVLIWLAVRSPGHRLPVAVIVSCQILGRIAYAVDELDLGLIGPGESVLLTMGVVAVGYAVALLRFHAIDPVAAAREAALQQMRDGFVVLDAEDRIVDVNPRAAAVLGAPARGFRRRRVDEVLPVTAADLRRMETEGAQETEITIGCGESARQYAVSSTALRGRDGGSVGTLVGLHDVTEQRGAQARILEQQRVVATLQERERLARELHDGIGQALGFVGMQTQSALKWLREGQGERAGALLDRVVEVTRDAQAELRESILSLRGSAREEWSFLPALEEHLRRFQANFGLRVELSLAGGIDERTFDPAAGAHVLRAIQEAMTNARKHSGASSLRVCVERDGRMARVVVSDEGRGFDAAQLEGGGDGHLGLVFMRERMAQIGGSVRIDSVPGGGTSLRLDVPLVAE